MIIDSFDQSEPIIKVEDVLERKPFISDTCIVTFSKKIKDDVIETYQMRKVSELTSAFCTFDIYVFEYEGKPFLFYNSGITAALSAMLMYQVSYQLQVKNFIVFGSCGVLNKTAFGKWIIPSESYRDEGLSYHYAIANDTIKISNSPKIEEIFQQLKLNYLVGKNWTTDAIFQETLNKTNARKAMGCISVEMECSALQAVCDFYGLQLYTFFFTSDIIDDDQWDNVLLGKQSEKHHQRTSFEVALEIALRI